MQRGKCEACGAAWDESNTPALRPRECPFCKQQLKRSYGLPPATVPAKKKSSGMGAEIGVGIALIALLVGIGVLIGRCGGSDEAPAVETVIVTETVPEAASDGSGVTTSQASAEPSITIRVTAPAKAKQGELRIRYWTDADQLTVNGRKLDPRRESTKIRIRKRGQNFFNFKASNDDGETRTRTIIIRGLPTEEQKAADAARAAEEAARAEAEAEAERNETEQAFKDSTEPLDYLAALEYPVDYMNTPVVFSGTVVQREISEAGSFMLVAVDDDPLKIVWVTIAYGEEVGSVGGWVKVWGPLTLTRDYESLLGTMTVPEVFAMYLE